MIVWRQDGTMRRLSDSVGCSHNELLVGPIGIIENGGGNK